LDLTEGVELKKRAGRCYIDTIQALPPQKAITAFDPGNAGQKADAASQLSTIPKTDRHQRVREETGGEPFER